MNQVGAAAGRRVQGRALRRGCPAARRCSSVCKWRPGAPTSPNNVQHPPVHVPAQRQEGQGGEHVGAALPPAGVAWRLAAGLGHVAHTQRQSAQPLAPALGRCCRCIRRAAAAAAAREQGCGRLDGVQAALEACGVVRGRRVRLRSRWPLRRRQRPVMLGVGLVLGLGVRSCWPRGAQQQQGTSRVGGGELKDRPWAAAAPLQLHHDDLDNQGIQRELRLTSVVAASARVQGRAPEAQSPVQRTVQRVALQTMHRGKAEGAYVLFASVDVAGLCQSSLLVPRSAQPVIHNCASTRRLCEGRPVTPRSRLAAATRLAARGG